MTAPVWGCPWHGKVQGGQLRLPNGQSMPWVQPDGTRMADLPSDPAKWITQSAGYTHRVAMPGVAPVHRTAEELASDEVDGMEWLSEAIIAGISETATGHSYLHGRVVDGWIYAAPDGSRWLIPALATYPWTLEEGLPLPMAIRRFGVLGGSPEVHSHDLHITAEAMGQAPSAGVTYHAKVESIRPDGSAAIIGLFTASSSQEANIYPLGFLLLTLSGTPGVDFSASLTALRTAQQTRGQITVSNGVTESLVRLEVTEAQSTEDTRGGASPNCTGSLDTITTYSTQWVAASDLSWPNTYRVFEGVNSKSASNRIVAMWFDSAGSPEELTLSQELSCEVSSPPPTISYSGRDVYREPWLDGGDSCYLAGGSWIEYHDVTRSRSSTQTWLATITLRAGLRSVTLTGSRQLTITTSASSTGLPGQRVNNGTKAVSDMTSTYGWPGDGSYSESGGLIQGTEGIESVDPYSASPADVHPGYVEPQAGSAVPGVVRRWSNNMIGMAVCRVDGESQAEIRWTDAITPAGVIPGFADSSAAVASAYPWHTYRPFGSWNPITGEGVIASADPVSWT